MTKVSVVTEDDVFWFQTIGEAKQWIKHGMGPRWFEFTSKPYVHIYRDSNGIDWDSTPDNIYGNEIGAWKYLYQVDLDDFSHTKYDVVRIKDTGKIFANEEYDTWTEISEEEWLELKNEWNGMSKSESEPLEDIERMIKSRRGICKSARFEVGGIYCGDHGAYMAVPYKVVSRTDKTITFVDEHGDEFSKRLNRYGSTLYESVEIDGVIVSSENECDDYDFNDRYAYLD